MHKCQYECTLIWATTVWHSLSIDTCIRTQTPWDQMSAIKTDIGSARLDSDTHSINGMHLRHFQINSTQLNSSNCSVRSTRVMISTHTHSQIELSIVWLGTSPFILCLSVCLIPFLWLIQSLSFPCSHCISIHLVNVLCFFRLRRRRLLLQLITLIQWMRLQSIHSHSQNNRVEFFNTIYRHFIFLNNFEVLQYENRFEQNFSPRRMIERMKGRKRERIHFGSYFHSIPFHSDIKSSLSWKSRATDFHFP